MLPLLEMRSHELARICRRRNVKTLQLFGSAASGDFDPDTSDIDFLVDFHPLPSGCLFDAYFGLMEDLESLFGRPVDLVMARSISNPYFLESINRTRTTVYGIEHAQAS